MIKATTKKLIKLQNSSLHIMQVVVNINISPFRIQKP